MDISNEGKYINKFLNDTRIQFKSYSQKKINSVNIVIEGKTENKTYIAKISPRSHRGKINFESELTRLYSENTDLPTLTVEEYVSAEDYESVVYPYYESELVDWKNTSHVDTFLSNLGSILTEFESINDNDFVSELPYIDRNGYLDNFIISAVKPVIREIAFSYSNQRYITIALDIEREIEKLPTENRFQLIHADLTLPNLLTNSNGEIKKVIDHELTQIGDIGFEFGKSTSRILHLYSPYTTKSYEELLDSLLDNYSGKKPRKFNELVRLYALLYTIKTYCRVKRTSMFHPWEQYEYTTNGLERYEQMLQEEISWFENKYSYKYFR